MIDLRPYQTDFYNEIRAKLAVYKKIIACAPTGSGKTKVFISICLSALSKGKTILIITESDKIYKQLASEVKNFTNINADSRLLYIEHNKVYIAMAQTLARRQKLIEQFKSMGSSLLSIYDEAHLGTATKLLLELPNSLLIGFTATPAMKWAKHLPILYNDIAISVQTEWLVSNGYLTPYQHDQVVPDGIDKLEQRGGEFTEESQERVFDTENAHSFVPRYLNKYAFKKCMVFCASIKSCESLAAYLVEQGIQVAVQHSKYDIRTEAQQSWELGQFHSMDSGVNVCISVASMNKGYDFPPVDLILLYRATTSLPLYLQMCGRASRLFPNKRIWTVVDFGGNGKRHGRWDFTHPWHELWNKVKKKREGVAPVKDCPKCLYLLPAMAMQCPNCGHEFKKQAPSAVEQVRSIMLEKVAAVEGKRLSQLTAIELAYWAKIANKKLHATRVARAQEQKNGGGFLSAFGSAMGYKNGWAPLHLPDPQEPTIDFYDSIVKI